MLSFIDKAKIERGSFLTSLQKIFSILNVK